MADFITLSCPSCGGPLKVTEDADRFACAYCGREQLVRRSGAVVSLSPVLDAVIRVGARVDRTGAELAVVRLKKELEELHTRRIAIMRRSPRPGTSCLWGVLLAVGIGSLVLGVPGSNAFAGGDWTSAITFVALVMSAVGAAGLFLLKPNTKHWSETTGAELKKLDQLIAKKNAELVDARDILST